MRRSFRLILIMAMCILYLLGTVGGAFAYFFSTVVGQQQPEFSLNDDGSSVITVNDISALFAATKDNYYNSDDTVSQQKAQNNRNRVTIKLGSDIILTSDLLVTADCHLDLGGRTLFLSEHCITFLNSYYGSMTISNGTITPYSSADKLIFVTPNQTVKLANVVFDDSAYDTDETYSQQHYVSEVGFDGKFVAYSALQLIAESLFIETDNVPARATYQQVSALANDGENYNFSSLGLLATHETCLTNGQHTCAYVCDDVDLPLNVYGFDNVSISYVSSAPAVFSNTGKVTPSGGVTNVTLTATVSVDGVAVTSYDFTLHVLDTNDSTAMLNLGKTMLSDYMKKYYGQLPNGSDYKYLIYNDLSLPALFANYNIAFSYQVDNNATPATDITATTLKSDYNNDGVNDAYYALIADNSLGSLNATVSYPANTPTASAAVSFALASVSANDIRNEYTVAQSILTGWYGSPVTVKDTVSGGINGYTTQELFAVGDIPADAITGYSVSAVSYSLLNNNDGVYAISLLSGTNTLHVVEDGRPETIADDVLLNVTFTYTYPSAPNLDVAIQIPIEFQFSDTGGGNFHAFLPYYTYFDRLLQNTISGYTMRSFSMPFSYGSGAPVVCYDISGAAEGSLSLALYYNGSRHALSLNGYTSYTEALDAYLTANTLTLQEIIAYGDSAWHFVIDTDYVPTQDNAVVLTYNYKSSLTAQQWATYTAEDSPDTSSFTLAGILRCRKTDNTVDANGMPDENLYKWVYDTFNNAGDTYTIGGTDYLNKFVLIDWLTQDNTLDNADNVIGVTNYKGVEFLSGTTEAILTNCGITSQAFTYLAQMPNLEHLNLSNNALTDRPDGGTDNFIATLATSQSISSLDLSVNSIYDFTDLVDLSSLSSVYVYSNISSGADSIFYGSQGLTNIGAYETLSARGVSVYNTISGVTPLLYSAGTVANDYTDLAGVEYQNKLAEGLSITLIYADFSNDPAFYGLATNYTDGAGNSATVTNRNLTWGYVGNDATTATVVTLTYSCTVTLSGQTYNISMVIEYPVTRVINAI